jgi:two-component system sensor histidine kinase TctE
MLDAIERGDVLIGYNLLGSYALTRKMRGSPIEIVMPEDYTLWLSRVALIPRGAPHPELGRRLLNYLLSAEGQSRLGTQTMMRPLATPLNSVEIPGIRPHAKVQAQPIALNPSLLVFLDHLKQERFIRSWRALVAAEP